MKKLLMLAPLALLLGACSSAPLATPPVPTHEHSKVIFSTSRKPTSVKFDMPSDAVIHVDLARVEAKSSQLLAYDLEGHMRLSAYGDGQTYNYLTSSGFMTGKQMLSGEQGQNLVQALLLLKRSGCNVGIDFSREGVILSVKSNCDPMAAAPSPNSAG